MAEKEFKLESAEKDSKKSSDKKSAFDDGVTIKLTVSPRKLLKWGIVLLILVAVFFLGWFSAGGSCSATVDTADTVDVAEVELAELEDSESVSKVTGFFKSLFAGDGTTAAVTVENNTTGSETEEIVEDSAEEVIVEVVEEDSEPVITSYDKVALSIGDVSIDWKGTWGKIKTFQYTIKNNEAGTIEPSYFLMLVEGYGDFEKKVPLPKSSQSLKSIITASSYATIPSGFAYNELSTGDLTNVVLTIIMYDASGKEMAQVKKTANLDGG
jgi:hypothetical protein